jgi:hypothetical protein
MSDQAKHNEKTDDRYPVTNDAVKCRAVVVMVHTVADCIKAFEVDDPQAFERGAREYDDFTGNLSVAYIMRWPPKIVNKERSELEEGEVTGEQYEWMAADVEADLARAREQNKKANTATGRNPMGVSVQMT